jgi:AcrR family transcriptional regulator
MSDYYVNTNSHEVVMITKKCTQLRKEEIVRAALDVVGKKGVRALTISAIAQSAGMSEANIYRHFSGKDAIYSALAEFIMAAVIGRAAAVAAESRKPLQKLETIFFSHMSLIAEQAGVPRFVFSEEIHLRNRKLSDSLSVCMGSYVETITGIIAAGIAEGELNQRISPRETALTFLGMIQFTALRWAINNESFDIHQETGRLWSNFVCLVS